MSLLKKTFDNQPSTPPLGAGGLLWLLWLGGLFSCQKSPKSDFHFTFLPSSETNITFNNQITESDSVNFYNNEYMYIGSGVGVGDFNNDGLQDVFFGGSQVKSKLYINKGAFQFEDITEKAGIKNTQWVTGVSVIDINQDGWQDIYICVSHFKNPILRKNLLYLNQGLNSPSGRGGAFTEQAEKYGLADTGFSSQATFLDYDKDGDLDIYLLNHKLFEPQPNKLVPIDTTCNSPSADKLFRNNSLPNGEGWVGVPFTDISKEAGISEDGYGLGVVVSDFNNDNYPDIYVANDYLSNDYFWQNKGNGHFKNILKSATKHQSFSSMGVDAADINNDLLPDLAVLDMMPNTTERKKMMVLGFTPEKFEMQRSLGYQQQFSRNMLQLNQGIRNNGEPIFSEIGHLAGIAETDWSWSVLMADFDNDSWRDMHISNGLAKDLTNNDFIAFTQETQENEYSFGGSNTTISPDKIKNWVKRLNEFEPVKKTNFFFKNNHSLQFSDESEQVGISESSVSHGAAYGDFDNDGDLDMVINNMNQEAFIMRNDLRKSAADSTNNFLKIQLKGNSGNLSGLGAKVLIYSNKQTQIIEQNPVRGYASTVDNRLHFGLGGARKIDSLKIIWPSGKTQKIENIKANQMLIFVEKDAELIKERFAEPWFVSSQTTSTNPPLFVSIQTTKTINFKHNETPFFDYYIRRLQPQKYSQLGPCMAKGDVNGDGLEDIFIGGAAGQSGKVFIQNSKGFNEGFTEKNLENKQDEDLAAEFFDADGDKDLDLIVIGGSTEYQRGFSSKPRLYINDGRGSFIKNMQAFPQNLDIFSSTIAVNDFDKDGDLDLFIGGRIDKVNFPKSSKSYLFENRKGKFIDITTSYSVDLLNCGMITDALWMDIDNDKIQDLIIAGEWMPIRFFKNTGKKLVEITDKMGLKNNTGMWRSLASADLDGDGDLDLIAGNAGKNNKYHATPERPYYLFAKDLDQNGSTDLLPAYFMKNNDKKYELYPDFDRHQIAEQTPIIKKKYLLHNDFAKATMNQLLDDLGRSDLQQMKVETTASVWLENLGNGTFKSHELPIEAQFAPINAQLINDFDGDKKQDILIAGNEYQTEVSTGRSDASIGLFLKGNGKGNFISIGFQQSGFLVEGDVKSMILLDNQVIVGINNENIKTFILQKQQK